ncbi:MAG: hypothetical protein KDC67_06200 [Ignavibacteriae bacterium]|nr:hypothetical protein [Ignavibacteriota bacterium]
MGAQALTREQQRSINGGSGSSGDGCQIYLKPSNGDPGGYWSDCIFTVSEAQGFYNSGHYYNNGDWDVTGYRCDSAQCG